MTESQVVTGIDRILSGEVKLPDLRYGFVTAAHARSAAGIASRRILAERYRVIWLFSPEHGLEGVAGAGDKVGSEQDRMTGLPVHSLYQHAGAAELIPADILDQIDAFIYDLPDVGVRFYTYISTCLQILDMAASHDKKVYILDRPNPLGGTVTEGLVLKADEFSFVGAYSLPIRYGLTIGELARLYLAETKLPLDLEVITCTGWKREQMFAETGMTFVIPSPNIPNWQTTVLYPGTCLIEGTNLSEGRGTSRPFTWFGAPWMDQEELFAELDKIAHPGLAIRPQGSIPSSSKHQGVHCKGVTLEITDPHCVRSVSFMVQAIARIRALYPDDFAFIPAFNSSVSFIERLMGRSFVEEGWPTADFALREAEAASAFAQRVKTVHLYS